MRTMKKNILLIITIALLQSFMSFAQTHVYDLFLPNLINTRNDNGGSSTIRYNDTDWGFSWTSAETGMPTSITVEMDYAVNCNNAPTNENVRLNGVNQGSQPTPGPYYCSYFPSQTAFTTWTLQPEDYNVGGLNTVLISPPSGFPQGINILPAYANAYVRVTVNYNVGINIKGLTNSIPNGDVTPIVGDDTEFGSVAGLATLDHTFTILNDAANDLILTGTPRVTVSGSPAFSIQTQPASATISPGDSETFAVRFAPTCATPGVQSAVVSIASDDPNENPYTFTVQGTGTDNIAPIALAQDITVQLDATGSVTINASDLNNGSTDNCGIGSYTMSIGTTGSICGAETENNNLTISAPAGSIFTAVDFANYGTTNGSCGSYIVDSCNASNSMSIVSSYLIGKSSAVIPVSNAIFGDPCNGTGKSLVVQASYGPSEVSLATKTYTCADLGVHTLTLTVTDVNGNSSTTTAIVTVKDATNPTVLTQDITAQLDAAGNASITAGQINNGSSDNCGIATVTVSPSTFTCANLGNNTVTLTVTDVNGNINTATAVVMVQDNIAPLFGIPATGIVPETLYYKFDGTGTTIPNLASTPPAGSENATINGSLTQNTSGICGTGSLVGTGGSSLTDYIDTNWNTNLGSDWTISFKTSNILSTTSVSYIFGDLNASSFRCFTGGVAGVNNWILRGPVNDVLVAGGATIAPHTVTFVYSQTAGNVKAYLDGVLVNTVAQGAITTTSGSTLKIGGYATSAGLASGGLMDEFGLYNRSLSAAEVAQLSSCPIAATTTNLDNVSLVNTAGTCGVAYTYVTPTPNDNCTVTLTQTSGFASGEIFPIGTTTNTFVATDSAGNTTTSTFDVTVEDVISPTAIARDITVQLDDTGSITVMAAQIDNGSSDDCGIASMTVSPDTFDCTNVGVNNTTLVTLTVTDVHGNISTATATVTVQDTTAPTVLTQDITVQLDTVGNATITVADIDGGSTDSCGIASLVVSQDTFNCSNVGDNIVTLTVTDVNGNESTATAKVTVKDFTVPTVLTQNIFLHLDAITGTGTITAAEIDNGSFDNCGIASISVSPTNFDYTNVGPNTVTLTVTDVSGNESTATATVSVVDVTPPTALAQDITVQLDNTGNMTITAAEINNGSFDNSGIASITVSPTHFDCSNVGSNTVTLTVQDISGKITLANAEVTVIPSFVNTISRNLETLTADEDGARTYQWMTYVGGVYANILNETNQSLNVLTTGSYAVDITKNGCTQRSAVFDMTTLGNKDFDFNSKLSVYPNPFNDVISINVDSNAKMEIYNLLGETIYSKKINSGTTSLNLSNNANGMYLMKITTENNQSKTVKIMKK